MVAMVQYSHKPSQGLSPLHFSLTLSLFYFPGPIPVFFVLFSFCYILILFKETCLFSKMREKGCGLGFEGNVGKGDFWYSIGNVNELNT